MLLEFKTKNFKSFIDELDFKMITAPKIKDLEYSVMNKKIGNTKEKILPTAVIYGPNASGKTNIIGAMEVFKNILINGHINNTTLQKQDYNYAKYDLELIPNNYSKENEPVIFYIKFIEKNMIFEYELKIILGKFSRENDTRRILEENLTINNDIIYKRKNNEIEIADVEKKIKKYLINDFDLATSIKISQSNLDSKELFFNSIFKTIFSKKIYNIVLKWFTDKFITIYRADDMEYNPKLKTGQKGKTEFFINERLNKAVKIFGMSCMEIAYPTSENEEDVFPVSIIPFNKEEKEGTILPSSIYESFGTIRFLNTFPSIMDAIENGKTLVIDEFDASIHPMAIMNIIKLFHNDEINKKGAQLIFNTHNPIFLNNNLFRRDEIHFVERDEENGGSEHYILSDFGTNGINGVRNTEDYMEKYFINKYGAIKDIDFFEIFKR